MSIYVVGRPKVTVTPSSRVVEVTQSIVLIATACGIGRKFSYTWYRTNQFIEGEIKPFLLINDIAKKNSIFHSYHCRVTDEYGNNATSNSVRLFVTSKLCIVYVCSYVFYCIYVFNYCM